MQTTTLYLLRHGQTVWNRDGNRYAGRSDVPLTEEGMAQASQAARALSGIEFDAIYSSTLSRTRDTAAIIAAERSVPVIAEARLNEMDYGQWEGRTHEEIKAEHAGQWETWAENPATQQAGVTGETANQVFARVSAFMDEFFLEGRTILVVGHHTTNRVYVAGTLGMPLNNYRRLSIDNLGICVLEISDWGTIWRGINQRWVELA